MYLDLSTQIRMNHSNHSKTDSWIVVRDRRSRERVWGGDGRERVCGGEGVACNTMADSGDSPRSTPPVPPHTPPTHPSPYLPRPSTHPNARMPLRGWGVQPSRHLRLIQTVGTCSALSWHVGPKQAWREDRGSG